ncbi:YqfO family protein [Moraxella nasovis]|uniref:Nif3-like dinuclear metal center hexameric protein n=1 Tax=Moraxella nasovis TaxID=2904121 RepID=UPI001F60F446|nr:YqfO family protein [Moraxella nasovis]UNU74186.1 YqfO family protein [Moraxella nasovis]
MYKLIIYIPQEHLDEVKEAVFQAGAGQFGNYSCCAWEVLGVGQFKPLKGANPTIGQVGTLETVKEWRVEMIVPDDRLHSVIQAYKKAHPYECPAYDVYLMVDV